MSAEGTAGRARVTYGDSRRAWHPRFVEYMNQIVDHLNYAGMPCTRDDEGKIDWTIPSNRPVGSKNWNGNALRREWWRAQAQLQGIPLDGTWISKTARRLHPFGEKPCQICGRTMKLAYIYPTRTTLRRLNANLPPDSQIDPGALLTIQEIARQLFRADPLEAQRALAAVFAELAGAHDLPEILRRLDSLADTESRKFSPGAMANPPDRLDGFHTYNLCCRSGQDTGRTPDNLGSYGVDRRAYEQWCEGDWAAADALMSAVGVGRCPKLNCQSGGGEVQLTADHVGPISLGFCHSPHFVVACRTCNSGKGNRMSFADVQTLLAWEGASGESGASWQARKLWDALKTTVRDDEDALLLSRLMRINQHHYLSVLSAVAERGATDALYPYLSPNYAENRYDFDGLNPTTLRYRRVIATRRQDTYTRSKKARAVRVAYDALRAYRRRDARNVHEVDDAQLTGPLTELNRAINRLLLLPSRFRAALNAALARGDDGREEGIAAVLDLGVDETEELAAARRAVADAVGQHMRVVASFLMARYRTGTHLRPGALARGGPRTTAR